ncbi:hypothetical protein RIEGSTA812A_PEG_954 [invertebrate metagenome]|uniref:Uncharacterized protein n=1 Tax=invertebrate metagenome TaxID=1711999 RepID=A0A484H7H4_9ZZZZ
MHAVLNVRGTTAGCVIHCAGYQLLDCCPLGVIGEEESRYLFVR